MSIRKILTALVFTLFTASAYALPSTRELARMEPFERAVALIKHYESWHSAKHYPLVGYGHLVQPGENFVREKLTKKSAEALLRCDLRKCCAMFREFGADSLLLGTLAYNVGPGKVLGGKDFPVSALVQKLRRGERDITEEYLSFCHINGKFHKRLRERRVMELAMLFDMPKELLMASKAKKERVRHKPPKAPKKPKTNTHKASASTQAYIARYAPLAVKFQEEYGIPASVTLAQGIIESACGTSHVARTTNNHFGVRLRSGAYRKYESVEESFRDHAKILATARYYKACRKLPLTDYRGWCWGLQKGGYAESPIYATTLIKVIEAQGLSRFDRLYRPLAGKGGNAQGKGV